MRLEGGAQDEGIRPLADFVDSGGPDSIAATIEMNAAGEIYPVVYLRRQGKWTEHALPTDPTHAFDGPKYVAELEAMLK